MTEPAAFLSPALDRPPQPLCWAALDPAQTAEALRDLTAWVDWLRERYRLDHRTIPGCWPEHGDLIEELSALHTAWQNAYTTGARPEAPLDWHTNFAHCQTRLTTAVARTGCRPHEHRAE